MSKQKERKPFWVDGMKLGLMLMLFSLMFLSPSRAFWILSTVQVGFFSGFILLIVNLYFALKSVSARRAAQSKADAAKASSDDPAPSI